MKTTMTTMIDAPVEIVFLWLDDNARLKQWVPNLVEDEAILETPEKLGTTFRQVFIENGKTMEMTGEITEYIVNEALRVDMSGDMFALDVGYYLKARSATQTELRQDTEIRFKGFMKFMTPIFWVFSKLSRKDPQAEAHAKLKEFAELEFKSQTNE